MKKIILSAVVLTALVSTSCKKKGCMDLDASNYNKEAKKDDGTCVFNGNVVWWLGQQESIGLTSNGVTDLNVYVNDTLIGNQASNVHSVSAPACGEATIVNKTFNLGKLKSKTISYKVLDENQTMHYSGNFTINAGCNKIEMK